MHQATTPACTHRDNSINNHKIQEGLPHNIKSECWYYVKHLLEQLPFNRVLSYCSETNKQQFNGEEGCSLLITRYIKNIKRSPRAYNEDLLRVTPTDAPVIVAVHQLLLKRFPQRFTINMSSDSSVRSPSSSASSSSDGATGARAGTRFLAAARRSLTGGNHSSRRSSTGKHSLDAATLSAGFVKLSVVPRNKGSDVSPCGKGKTNRGVKALV